jgi:hypothetical protein
MTDIKIKSSNTKPKMRRKPPRRSPSLNSMIVRSTWTFPSLITSTTGTISFTMSPSIANSSEYSTYQTLFTEVKLVSFTVILTATELTNTSTSHGRLVISTNMLQNESTAVNPTSFGDVQNQTKPVRVSTYMVRPFRYRMPVPRGLEFANIVADAPNPPTPWAGSPGTVRMYAAQLTVSTNYFQLDGEAIWHLRGRQ